MLLSHEREKLINAILFFAINVHHLGKTKLFKLLYFLDFGHYRDTGRSVTGMDYYAWKMGPVPVDLQEEIDQPEPDLCEKIAFVEIPRGAGGFMLKVEPRADFDETHFTSREMRLMREIADEFREARADEMVEATHLENLPWYKVYVDEGRRQQPIPYDYALRKQERETLLPAIKDREALVAYLKGA